MAKIGFPFGPADVLSPAYAVALPIPVSNPMTIIKTSLTGAQTINLAISKDLPAGSIIQLQAGSDGTARATTFGTGFLAPVLAGVINKILVQTFIYDGVQFTPFGASLQIN